VFDVEGLKLVIVELVEVGEGEGVGDG